MKKRLKDIVSYSNSRKPISEVTLDNYVTTDNLLQNKKGKTTADSLPPNATTTMSYDENNILISNIRPYLKKIWFADRSGGNSADVLVLKVKESYNPEYIYYSVFQDCFFEHMMLGAKGTKMPRGDKNQILNYKLFVPSWEEQNSIAKVLSNLDSKIELNNQINQQLEEMAKTIYDYWFVQFDFPDEEGKPYKSSGGKMVYDRQLRREIPEGWGVKSIDGILQSGFNVKRIPKGQYQKSGTWPIVDQSVDFIAGFTSDQESIIKADSPKIIFGDHTRIVKLINFDFARGADGTQVLVSKEERMPQHLFYHSILKIDLSNYGYARHFKFLKDIQIALPDLKLANRFESLAQSIHLKIKDNVFENLELASLRDWLLPMLMNGQVTLKRH